MKFGELLREIRLKNNLSLRKLGEETEINFSFIDKVEKGLAPASENFLEKIIEYFPLNKNELVDAYTETYISDTIVEALQKKVEKNTIFETFFEKLNVEDRKEILKNIVDKLEFQSYKQGTIEEDKAELEIIRKEIEKLQ
ncbi:helix-turn-helix domain-containing protein [Fusobacterium mortiferum]|uniref:Helix-turn-helix transcriptional regulator n=1 Tax=Fusobacterium mortiferum TaxID=850 RepID=A0ABS2FZ93_FUSMR|nr:helix-turn-helix transcriptional regulator [Fusobacterium mortiferum]MBM6690464.1 helix-turn-helix transcriptional regulator [Fusobacterium mortiferum]MBM6874471.1 helix-turn-helix transcriptional regulator [Fusobacterium mortiferum]